MSYSEEEIQNYLNILESYKLYENITSSDDERYKYLILEFDDDSPIIQSNKVSCNNCDNTHFINDKGYKYCNKCGHSIGHILVIMIYQKLIDVIFIKNLFTKENIIIKIR